MESYGYKILPYSPASQVPTVSTCSVETHFSQSFCTTDMRKRLRSPSPAWFFVPLFAVLFLFLYLTSPQDRSAALRIGNNVNFLEPPPHEPPSPRKHVRVLCWILTGPRFHMTRAIHVKRTWGSRCDKLLFMSSVSDPYLGTVKLEGVQEGHSRLWKKTQMAFRYIWDHHRDDADWFLKADDDTYVLTGNLRDYLKDFDPNRPYYLGGPHHYREYNGRPVNVTANIGGVGYVVSKEALRLFIEEALPHRKECYKGFRSLYKGDEDTEFAVCMRSVGVLPWNTKDSLGRFRFHYRGPVSDFQRRLPDFDRAWDNGPKWISDRPITFHYVSPSEMYVLEYLINHVTNIRDDDWREKVLPRYENAREGEWRQEAQPQYQIGREDDWRDEQAQPRYYLQR